MIAITPPSLGEQRLEELLSPLASSVDAIQLRWPDLSARELLERARRLAAIRPRPLLLINDRFDVALAAGVDGVHLRDQGLPPSRVRELVSQRRSKSERDFLIGVSRHELAGVKASDGADYVLVSPVFETASKPQAKTLGPLGLAALAAAVPASVIALGGITPERVGEVIGAGAHGVAVLSGILGAQDPLLQARRYRAGLG